MPYCSKEHLYLPFLTTMRPLRRVSCACQVDYVGWEGLRTCRSLEQARSRSSSRVLLSVAFELRGLCGHLAQVVVCELEVTHIGG